MTNNDNKKTKNFLFQILTEIKMLFTSKFTIILVALIVLAAIAVPIISKINSNKEPETRYNRGWDDIVIDGVTVPVDSPIYWDIRDIVDMKKNLEDNASTKADDLTLEFFDIMLEGYLIMAEKITSYEDFRYDLTWQRVQAVSEKFVFENLEEDKDDLMQAIQYRMHYEPTDFNKRFYSLSQIEVLERITELEQEIEKIDNIVLNNDYVSYYELQIDKDKEGIEENLERIEALEKDIVENPANEEMYSEQIENLEQRIRIIEEINIPSNQYRIDNNIIPDSGDWRDVALRNKVNASSNLIYDKKLTREEFEEQQYMQEQYKTYKAYTEWWEKQREETTEKLYVAEQSLATGKPDMNYVDNGTRRKKTYFLWYSLVLAIFAAVVGGGIIAREYQSGTIRLLLIRPKTRTKLVLSKFLALMIVCIGVYMVSDIVNALSNGVVFGFKDYTFPNYTISSGADGISFWAYYLPKFFTCAISILFAGATAFLLSSATKNTALSVAIPIVLFVGSLIVMQFISYRPNMNWLSYTPIPYINFSQYYISSNSYSTFVPKLGFGIPLMTGLSLVFVALGVLISEKRDVTN